MRQFDCHVWVKRRACPNAAPQFEQLPRALFELEHVHNVCYCVVSENDTELLSPMGAAREHGEDTAPQMSDVTIMIRIYATWDRSSCFMGPASLRHICQGGGANVVKPAITKRSSLCLVIKLSCCARYQLWLRLPGSVTWYHCVRPGRRGAHGSRPRNGRRLATRRRAAKSGRPEFPVGTYNCAFLDEQPSTFFLARQLARRL